MRDKWLVLRWRLACWLAEGVRAKDSNLVTIRERTGHGVLVVFRSTAETEDVALEALGNLLDQWAVLHGRVE